MIYQEKKINKIITIEPGKYIEHNFEYKCEDLFGEAIITSINKLNGETLDELVCDIIMAKQLRKGNTPGHEIVFDAVFKDQWSEEIKEEEKKELFNKKTNMKSKNTTALLAFLLGGWGVHRMYLGQWGLGLLYLIFCWTFIPTIIATIDFIVFLVMSEEKFNNKYNK
jgi:TM2 domain-containing membrane protein YozV